MRRESMLVTITVIVGLIAIVASSIWLVFTRFYDDVTGEFDIKVNADTESFEKIDMGGLALTPGEEKEYTFNLDCEDTGSYKVYLLFEESEDGGLKSFVNVKVTLNGKKVADGALSDFISRGSTDAVSVDLEAGSSAEVKVIYSMPETVGNDAQNAYSDFDMSVVTSILKKAEESADES